ncbi:small secreted protein [Streptomyces alkaliterrae]|uniref:Small secreted protein n=1 Tax=Streptomyces alkaliterrae TaxID=2213162 RepID=A0A5P0YMT9_9ACTN|nr:small secreted protein [Streptomyces alkaliterrae]MBB1253336.1 small secreted protein [Streptomyces alkaliterrae]MBB1259905.1 small secreted protein [Streptomyces alkaliterrae]MQS01558.1 small secreted protein [Streptomyces alkaliterrae]
MNNKLAAALCGSAVLALALTGCGGDEDDGKADAWAKKVCDQVQPQVKKIQDANTAIAEVSAKDSSSKEVQQADSTAFQQISEAYKALAGAVARAGEPPVEDGAKLQKDAVKELNDISASYAGLKTKVDEMDTKDQAKFADGLRGISKELSTLGKSGDVALNRLQSGDLGKAMAEQPGCQKPAGGGKGAEDAKDADAKDSAEKRTDAKDSSDKDSSDKDGDKDSSDKDGDKTS